MHGQRNKIYGNSFTWFTIRGGLTCVMVTHDAIEKFSSSKCRTYLSYYHHTKWIWAHFLW